MEPSSTGVPSTSSSRPPSIIIRSPVAVTMMSAASSVPSARRTPPGVKRSIAAVTIEALPSRRTAKKSPSAAMQTRWSQGL